MIGYVMIGTNRSGSRRKVFVVLPIRRDVVVQVSD